MIPDLALRLREIEHNDQLRKSMIRLCVYKARSLSTSKDTIHGDKVTERPASAGLESLQEKLQDYERRISVMKSQLSIKDQAHDAKVEELKMVVDRLQKQVESSKGLDLTSAKAKQRLPPRKRPTSSPGLFASSSSSFGGFSSSQRQTLLSADADKPGRGNSFEDSGPLSSQPSLKLSSQPSLKLSRSVSAIEKGGMSSAEASPVKPKNRTPSGQLGSESPDFEANSTAKLGNVSDTEDAFQSANSTFDNTSTKEKKRKIRLFSVEASKRILQQQNAPFDTETEDRNSLNYYQDENFQEDAISPKPAKRPLEAAAEAPPAKKRHVFKI